MEGYNNASATVVGRGRAALGLSDSVVTRHSTLTLTQLIPSLTGSLTPISTAHEFRFDKRDDSRPSTFTSARTGRHSMYLIVQISQWPDHTISYLDPGVNCILTVVQCPTTKLFGGFRRR